MKYSCQNATYTGIKALNEWMKQKKTIADSRQWPNLLSQYMFL